MTIQFFSAGMDETGDGIDLHWEVQADEPFRGFNLYRRTGGESYTTRLNRNGLLLPDRRRFKDKSIVAGFRYEYVLGLVSDDGTETVSVSSAITTPAGRTQLFQNTPNPFNPRTAIGFTLDRPARARLEIYDAAGRFVRTLIDNNLPAGYNRVEWDGRNNSGFSVGSGVYVYRLQAGGRTFSRKMVLLQ